MSEGEFEKRLRKADEGAYVSSKDLPKGYVHSNWIRLIVEEAKKESPEVLYPKTLPHKGKVAWCNPEKAAKWFERWFGKQ